jgi:hypothetical protein
MDACGLYLPKADRLVILMAIRISLLLRERRSATGRWRA